METNYEAGTERLTDPKAGLLMRRSLRTFANEAERHAFVASLVGIHRDLLPPSDEFLARKHAQLDAEEQW